MSSSSVVARMAKRCQELAKLSPTELRSFFSSFDVVMTDCDGVLWHGNNEIEGSAKTVRKLRDDLGKKVFFCTNNSTKSRQDYVEKCEQLGFGGTLDEMVGTSYLAAEYLKAKGFDGTVYVVGSTGITKELDLMGIKHVGLEDPLDIYQPDTAPPDRANPSAPISTYPGMTSDIGRWGSGEDGAAPEGGRRVDGVVVGFDLHLSYRKMVKAATVLWRPDTVFVATNTDEQFPTKSGAVLPGTGAIVTAVATAAGRKPVIMGKPSPAMFEAVRRAHPATKPERTLMIGDRANTDILLGANCGLQTLLVGTGCHSLEDTRRWETSENAEERRQVADFYVDKLGDLVELMRRSREGEEKA